MSKYVCDWCDTENNPADTTYCCTECESSAAEYAESRPPLLATDGPLMTAPGTKKLTIAQVVAEIEWCKGTDSPESIAHRLGTTPQALARRLYRHGNPTLARLFTTEN